MYRGRRGGGGGKGGIDIGVPGGDGGATGGKRWWVRHKYAEN